MQLPPTEPKAFAGESSRVLPTVILVGLMGVGKTTIGRALARRMRWTFCDSDHEIQLRTGVSIPTIFEIEGEAGFRRRESSILQELCRQPRTVLATGGGAILDPANRALLRDSGLVVYLSATAELLFERTRHDRNRPLLQVADPRGKLAELLAQRAPLYREVAHVEIDAGAMTQPQTLNFLEAEILNRCAL